MKKIMMTLVLGIVALTASAQNTGRDAGSFTLQPKAGIGMGHISGSWDGGADAKWRTGFVAGVEGEYYINDWLSAAAGVNYAQQGWKFEGSNLDGSSFTHTTKLDYINVPIVANFYISEGFALKTGVQMGFLASAKMESKDVKENCENTAFSIPIGISGEYNNFVLDARYNIGITKVNKYGDNSQRSDLFVVTIGYKFQL